MSNWWKKAQAEGLRFENRHEDTHGGGWDAQDQYVLIAYRDEQPVGYIQYNVFRDEYTVEMINVGPNTRQGIGTALWMELRRIAGDSPVHSGWAATSEGHKWWMGMTDEQRGGPA